jgi:hypothetical protein
MAQRASLFPMIYFYLAPVRFSFSLSALRLFRDHALFFPPSRLRMVHVAP